ncbi:MAG: HEPN domain-containing protein [Nanoarchaeota archaeon]
MNKIFEDYVSRERITKSNNSFKIKLFLKKGESSLLIAKHIKETKEKEPEKLYWNYWAITVSYYAMLYCAKALILTKGYEVHDHDAAQIALAALCIPDKIEKEDLEILSHSYKIFEDEYVKYFEDAKKESHIARYSAIKTYTERRLDEIFENARKFVGKISLILSE